MERDITDEDRDRRTDALTAYRWWERIGWLRWLFANGGEMAGRMVALGVIGATSAWVGYDAIDARSRGKFLLPVITAERLSPATQAYVIDGVDENGRRADFDIIIADKAYAWERGSAETLTRNDKPLSRADIEASIFDPLVRARLKDAKQLITVGTASAEGDPTKETFRAGKRAEQTAVWLTAVVDKDVPVSTLNLGQYQKPCEACETAETNWQRPFLIIALKQAAWGTDIAEALADALGSASNLPAPDRYSAFALARFR